MTGSERQWTCCGGRGLLAGGRREPFALPGTSRRYSRDRVVDVRHVRLEVAVDLERKTIEGVARHTVSALNDGTARVTFDAAELTILGVTDEGGKALRHEYAGGQVVAHLGRPLAAGEETTVSVAYRGSPRRGLWFVGPDEHAPKKPLQAWTQGQDEDSRYWFPCFDYPNDKATTEVLATVDSRFTAVSNGALVAKADGPRPGTTTWHWRLGTPHVSYLVTLAIGEFEEVSLGDRPVPLVAYVPKGPGRAAEARRSLGRTAEMVACFGERFGVAYPYEKYAQVVVHDFVFGGMENTSATTLTEYALYDERAALDYEVDDLVAHELGHQWFGDLLTCRDWSHAWLNEGFATYCEAVFREHHFGRDEFLHHQWVDAKDYFAEDLGDYRRPVVSRLYEAPIDVFDRHLYQKGGWVLHMLRAELGEEGFWKSIRGYVRENAGKHVVTDDLRRAVEDATGRNLEWFFDQWIHAGGYPELRASWAWDDRTRVATVSVRQTQGKDDDTPEAFRATLSVAVRTGKDVAVHRLAVSEREHAFHLPLPEKPDAVWFDPEGDLLAGWSVDEPPDASRRALRDGPLVVRLRAAGRLAKDAGAETVAALSRAVREDPFWGVRAEAAAALGKVRTPAAREALLAALGKVEHPKARRAVASALGQFREDEAVAEALAGVLSRGDPSIFVEAEAADALGRTRQPAARAALERAIATKESWADTVRAGAVRGLGRLADPSVVPALVERLRPVHHPRVRSAAALALAEVGSRLVVRDAVREVLEPRLDDRDFRVQLAAIVALRTLGDERAVPALRRAADQALDGRIRRGARTAARRLEQQAERTAEVARLSDALDALRRQAADLATRLEKLEVRANGASPRAPKKAGPPSRPRRKGSGGRSRRRRG
jgi:aminopeptidase N